jgi:hypothetical protein
MIIHIQTFAVITPKMFLRVQEEQGAFTVRFLMRTYDSFSAVSITTIVFPYKTRTISYMHIFSIFGRLYHINRKLDMHIFSIFSRKYHINSHVFVFAFAPSRVLCNLCYHSNVMCSFKFCFI